MAGKYGDSNDPWRNGEGEYVNPGAPAGGGGTGNFRGAGPLDAQDAARNRLPAPESPAARYLPPPDPLDGGEPLANPPPKTTPTDFKLTLQKPAKNVEVKIEVLADKTSDEEPAQAHTRLSHKKVLLVLPTAEFDNDLKVTKITREFSVKGTANIQIRYRTGVKSTDTSAYGRGTTQADKDAQNTTVGFHESCHLLEMVRWLKDNPIPVPPPIQVGMLSWQFTAARDDYEKAFNAYWKSAGAYTYDLTDETEGADPKRSQYMLMNNLKDPPEED